MNTQPPSPAADPLTGPEDAQLGNWPESTPTAGVVVSGLVWAGWIAFLVWMMIERMSTHQ